MSKNYFGYPTKLRRLNNSQFDAHKNQMNGQKYRSLATSLTPATYKNVRDKLLENKRRDPWIEYKLFQKL